MWLVARRVGARAAGPTESDRSGRGLAWAATILLATSPFAIRYATETRMYSLIIVLVLWGCLALGGSLARPTAGRLVAVSVVSGLLMLTHYWSLYLLAAVCLLLAWMCWRPVRGITRAAAAQSLCAVVLGSALFAPWVPSFRWQLLHTGTPWAHPAYLGNLGTTISDWFGMGTNLGRLVGYLAFGLALFGVFGRAVDGTRVDLDLRGRPAARPLVFVLVGTLLVAVAGSELFGGAYNPRYTAVVFVPFLLLVALGVCTLADRRVRQGVLALVVIGGLAAAVPNVTTQRTQAARASAVINARGSRGDAVVYCPDQVSPAMDRLLTPGRFAQFPYPGGNPARVDWVDYATRFARSNPTAFARNVVARIGPTRNVWLVWSPDYPPTTSRCLALITAFGAVRPVGHQVFGQDAPVYYEHEFLERFYPLQPAARSAGTASAHS
jgi:mannosyltransferase